MSVTSMLKHQRGWSHKTSTVLKCDVTLKEAENVKKKNHQKEHTTAPINTLGAHFKTG